MPRIRVILPTYNRAHLVGEAIESALAQSFKDFEIVVADDESTDDTEEVIRNFSSRDSRIRYLKCSHGGLASTRNKALKVNGEYEFVAFLDDDDLWSGAHLEETIRVLETQPDVGLVFSKFETVDFSGKWSLEQLDAREKRVQKPIEFGRRTNPQGPFILDSTVFKNAFIRSEFSPHPSTVVIRRNVVRRPEWFDPSLEIYEDLDLWLHLATTNQTFAFIDSVHVQVRYHGDNLSAVLQDLSSPVFFRRQKSALKHVKTKLKICSSKGDREFVLKEVGRVAYLIGQCCVEQFDLSGARYYYKEALKHQKCWRNFKGLMLSFLPFSVFYSARKIANGHIL